MWLVIHIEILSHLHAICHWFLLSPVMGTELTFSAVQLFWFSQSESDSPGPGPWKVWKQLRQLRRLRRSSRTHCHVARLHLPSQEWWKDSWRCSNPNSRGSTLIILPPYSQIYPPCTWVVWSNPDCVTWEEFARLCYSKFLSFQWSPAVELSILVAIRRCFRARPNCFSRVIFDYSKGSRNINASTLLPICRAWDASDCISHQFGDLLFWTQSSTLAAVLSTPAGPLYSRA